MSHLQAGDDAPEFALLNQHGKEVRLSDFRGRKVLLYFYPKADTSGCTTQAVSIRDALDSLEKAGVTVLGVSPDPPEKQNKFDAKHGLGFTLLSDPDNRAAVAYGAWGEKSMCGKKSVGVIRSSFLIDEQGKVIKAWYKISPKDTVPKAAQALGI
jgi:peroxiredoxin Q/BCP